MSASRWFPALALLLIGGLNACAGGSGSSGFDIRGLESAAIDRAILERRCVDFEGVPICPIGAAGPSTTPTPVGTPGATPVPGSPTPSVDLPAAEVDFAGCAQATPDGPCSFSLHFDPQGFAPGTEYRLAVRTLPDGDWSIGGEPTPSDRPELPGLEGEASAVVATDTTVPPMVQFAVLVFSSTEPPTHLQLEILADSGADAVFVTTPVAAVSAGPPG